MSIMGGKNLPIDQIVERLRTTDVTLTALMTEYHVGYKTLVTPICAAIGKTAFAALMKQRLGRGGRYTRFRPGHKTWNAGMKGWCPPGCRATQFRPGAMRGNAARRYRGIGSVVVRVGKPLSNQARARRRPSSRWIKIRDDGRTQDRYIPFARYLWEREHGPVPAGMFVVHRDNDTMNDSIENLILVDRREHMRRLYERPAVIAKCRRRAGLATVRRHAENRQAKKWRKAAKAKARSIWECESCGADFQERVFQCPKCGSLSIAETTRGAIPDSMEFVGGVV